MSKETQWAWVICHEEKEIMVSRERKLEVKKAREEKLVLWKS